MDPLQQPQSQPVVETKKSFGPIIGIVVIVVLLVIGGLYVWTSKAPAAAPVPVEVTKVVPQAAPVSKSDDVTAIDKDLQIDSASDIDVSGLDDVK